MKLDSHCEKYLLEKNSTGHLKSKTHFIKTSEKVVCETCKKLYGRQKRSPTSAHECIEIKKTKSDVGKINLRVINKHINTIKHEKCI